MQSFQAGGHEWKIPALTVGLVQDVNEATGFNLYAAAEKGGEFIEMLLSPFTIAGVLWTLCEPQAKELKVDERAFARGLTSTAIEAAGEALLEAVLDFFPRAKAATALKASLRNKMDNLDSALIAHLKKQSTASSE